MILNLSEKNNVQFDILDDRVSGEYKSLFAGTSFDFTNEKYFKMPAWESAILYK